VLPALILHGYDVELSTNADLFCFDVRSGYLYGTYHDQDVYSKGATLISNTNPDKIKEKQIETMLPRLVSFVKEMLAQKKLFNGK
jgi:ribosomal protein L13